MFEAKRIFPAGTLVLLKPETALGIIETKMKKERKKGHLTINLRITLVKRFSHTNLVPSRYIASATLKRVAQNWLQICHIEHCLKRITSLTI
jgi:hypothetical protein